MSNQHEKLHYELELFRACESGNADKVRELLLSGKVQLNEAVYDFQQHGPLHPPDMQFAMMVNGSTALHFACAENQHQLLRMLLEEFKPDQSYIDKQNLTEGITALSFAAGSGNLDCVKLLVECGKANMELRDKRRMTPLIGAAMMGQFAVCEYLLEHGADVNARTEAGQRGATAAQMAGAMPWCTPQAREATIRVFEKYNANVERQ